MKRKIFMGVLCAEAVVCVLVCLWQNSFGGNFNAAVMSFFDRITLGMESLSSSIRSGNAAAIVAYFAVSLLPVASLIYVRKRRKLYIEDGLLALLSVVLFAVFHLIQNPRFIDSARVVPDQALGGALYSGMLYSIVCGYFMLRVLRLFSTGGTKKLFRYMSVILNLLNVYFVLMIFGVCFNTLLKSITFLQQIIIGKKQQLGLNIRSIYLVEANYVLRVLKFFGNALPYVFNMLIVFTALRLSDKMRADRYSAETVAAARRISRLCSLSLATTVLINIGFELLQYFLGPALLADLSGNSVESPVFSIAFVLSALLLSRLVTENKQLKDDNDMFV